MKHLEKLFLKCRSYSISLNTRKSNFSLKEKKLSGNIISKDGIKIDLDRVNAILKVEETRSKNEIQSFIRQVNFLKRFIPSFADILRNVTNMMKKHNDIKWIVDSRRYFKYIKKAITEAPGLVIPDFPKKNGFLKCI